MKKIAMMIICFALIASCAYANPIAPGDFGGTVFGSALYKLGIGPTIGIEIVFLLVMFGISICLSYKSLEVKNKPENKKSFTIIAIIILIVTILTGCLLIKETVSTPHIEISSGPFDISL